MIQMIQFTVWFIVLNTVANHYWNIPTERWWTILIINIILSIIMVSKGE